jgi:hypothetical protein
MSSFRDEALRSAWLVASCLFGFIASGCDSGSGAPDANAPRAGQGGHAWSPLPERDSGMSRPVPSVSDAAAVDEVEDEDAGSPAAACNEGASCSLLDAQGCDRTETCQLVLTDDGAEPSCVPRGVGAEGAACSASEDCDRGLDCTSIDRPGTCRRYCCDFYAASECPSGQACRVALVDSTDKPTGAGLCDLCDSCDPLTQAGCAAEQACYVTPDSSGNSCALCLPRTDDRIAGTPCSAADQCAPGHGCFSVNGVASTCALLCDATINRPCDSGSRCASLALADAPQLGICVHN